MALVATLRANSISATGPGTGTYTSASFTPSANSLLVVAAHGQHSSGSSDPSTDFAISNTGGLTFTAQVNTGDAVPWSHGARIWTAPVGGSPAAMTVSVGTGGLRNMAMLAIAAVDFTGYDTSTPVGAVGSVNTTTGGVMTVTLGASPAAVSMVFGCACVLNGGSSVTPGSGCTELFDTFDAGVPNIIEGQTRTGSTSTSFEWTISAPEKALGVAIEVKAAGVGGTSILRQMMNYHG